MEKDSYKYCSKCGNPLMDAPTEQYDPFTGLQKVIKKCSKSPCECNRHIFVKYDLKRKGLRKLIDKFLGEPDIIYLYCGEKRVYIDLY
jgi:hypothetical protein